MNIFVCLPLTPHQAARLPTSASGHHIHLHAEADLAAEALSTFNHCEIAFGNPPAEWIAGNSRLRWVQLESVGFGEYTGLNWAVLGRRLQMSNLAGFFAEPVAQSILAGVLAHYRGIGELTRLQAGGIWMGDALRPRLRTLQGAHVVLFGKGDINRRVGELLAPFGCMITSFGSGWAALELHQALSQADVVVCTVPDTPATRGLFGRAMFAEVKAGSLFVNFGRGSLVDEQALADAVESGHLAGAVVDVTRQEPLPPDHRFWACRNILLTQHTGGGTGDEVDRKIDFFLANLDRYLRHAPLHGRVDFARGY